MNKRKFHFSFAYLFAAAWFLLTIFPLYVTFLSSVKDNDGINLGMFRWPDRFLWSNYAKAINDAHILRAIFNSVFVAFASTALVILVCMFAAYVLARKTFKLNNFIYGLFMLGVMIPIHSTIIPISGIATSLGAKDTFWFLILTYTAFNLSQGIFLFTGYLCSIDRDLDEAAIIDGCGDFKLVTRILMPVCLPIISTEAILSFIFGYGELIFSMILLSNESKYTVSRAMLTFQGAYRVDLGPIFASIILVVIPMIVIYVLFHEKVQSDMMTGSVKG